MEFEDNLKYANKSEIIYINPENNGHVWQPTMNLRWVNRREYLTRIDKYGNNECYGERFINVLQQEFRNGEGQIEWKDIPLVVI